MTLLLDSGNFRQRKISVAAPAAEQQLSGTKRGRNVPGEQKIVVPGTKRGRNVPGGEREGVREDLNRQMPWIDEIWALRRYFPDKTKTQ